MPKSRKNKTNKEQLKAKLNKFTEQKTRKIMEGQVPKFRPFRQVPHWDPDADIPMKGRHLSILQEFFNIFAEPISVMQEIFSSNLDNGNIQIKYIDNEGKEISKEEVQAYMLEMKEFFAKEAEKAGGELVEPDSEGGGAVQGEQATEVTDTPVQEVSEQPEEKPKRKLKVV